MLHPNGDLRASVQAPTAMEADYQEASTPTVRHLVLGKPEGNAFP